MCRTTSRVPATSNDLPSASAMSGRRSSPYSAAQSIRSSGCSAISASLAAATSTAALTWSLCPWVQHDGDDPAVPDGVEDGRRVVRRVDDEHLVVVADQPDVVVDVPLAAVEGEGARRDDLLDAGRHQSTTTERRTSPRCIFSNASSTSPSPMVSETNPSRSNRPCR